MGLGMDWWQLSISDSQPSGWHSWEDLVHLYQTADNYGSLETNKLIFWRISCHKNSPIFYQIFQITFFSYMGFPCLQHIYWSSCYCEDSNFNSFSLFRQFLFPFFLSIVLLSWNFVRFQKFHFQTDAENFSFLSWKIRKFHS